MNKILRDLNSLPCCYQVTNLFLNVRFVTVVRTSGSLPWTNWPKSLQSYNINISIDWTRQGWRALKYFMKKGNSTSHSSSRPEGAAVQGPPPADRGIKCLRMMTILTRTCWANRWPVSQEYFPPWNFLQAIEQLSPDKLREFRDIFSFFDRDGGGSIGAEEFETVMRTFGWNPKVMENGALSLVEVYTDTALWLVETIVFLRQFSYAIKTLLKALKAPH